MKEDLTTITQSAYRILDFLPEGDPLKNKAKERVLAILEGATLVFNSVSGLSQKIPEPHENVQTLATQLLCDIDILENYFYIAKYQGWVDGVNFLIIVNEYKKINSSIEVVKASLRQPKVETVSSRKENPTGSQKPISDQGKYSPRQGEILKILSKKEKAQVADFLKELPDVTKRTIRRDLDDLLKKGKVVRVGEWNQVMYSLGEGRK